MVLKRSKLGINSGNSFPSRAYRLLNRSGDMTAAILGISYRAPEQPHSRYEDSETTSKVVRWRIREVLKTLGFDHDQSMYRYFNTSVPSSIPLSLNKKRRWQISDTVVDVINSKSWSCAPTLKPVSTDAETDSNVKKRKSTSGRRARRNEQSHDTATDSELLGGKNVDCGISVARFGVMRLPGRTEVGKYVTGVLYANSDAPNGVVYAADCGDKRNKAKVASKSSVNSGHYADFRDLVNNGYAGDLLRRVSSKVRNQDHLRRKKFRQRHHNAHFRGIQRPALLEAEAVLSAPPRASRSRYNLEGKKQFEDKRTISRPEILFSIAEPRKLTTESLFRQPRDLSPWPVPHRATRFERYNEMSCQVKESLCSYYDDDFPTNDDHFDEYDLLEPASPWPVEAECDSSLNEMIDSESGIEFDGSQTDSVCSDDWEAVDHVSRPRFDLSQFVVTKKPCQRTGKRSKRSAENSVCEAPKNIKIFLASDCNDSLLATQTFVQESAETSESAESVSTVVDDAKQAAAIEKLIEQLATERKNAGTMRVKVEAEQLSAENLKETFGEQYVESQSYPRIVSIDVVGESCQNFDANLLITVNELPKVVEDFVVVDGATVNVSLRLNVDVNDEQKDAIQSGFAELVSTLDCIDDIGYFYARVCSLLVGKSISSKTSVPPSRWCKTIENTSVASLNQVPVPARFVQTLDVDPLASTKQEDCCCICYCEAAEIVRIAKCGHDFCVECLARYVVGRAFEGRTKIECCAYKCDSELDLATVCSVLPATAFFSYLRRQREASVEQRKSGFVWCPNEQCRCLLVRSDLAQHNRFQEDDNPDSWKMDTECVRCGTQFCFDCGAEAHFPTSCKAQDKFSTAISQRNLASQIEPSEFSLGHRFVFSKPTECTAAVKRCGRCHLVIEKGEGCTHMTCRCGHQFCWTCLRDWTLHCQPSFAWDCALREREANVIEFTDEAYAVQSNSEYFFKTALVYRSACCDQSVRLQQLRDLMSVFDSSVGKQFLEDAVLREFTEMYLRRLSTASETLVEALRFFKHFNATIFIDYASRASKWDAPASASARQSGRSRRGNVSGVAKKLKNPLDSLRFGLLLLNSALSELYLFDLMHVALKLESAFVLRRVAAISKRKSSLFVKLDKVNDYCRTKLEVCRRLVHLNFLVFQK